MPVETAARRHKKWTTHRSWCRCHRSSGPKYCSRPILRSSRACLLNSWRKHRCIGNELRPSGSSGKYKQRLTATQPLRGALRRYGTHPIIHPIDTTCQYTLLHALSHILPIHPLTPLSTHPTHSLNTPYPLSLPPPLTPLMILRRAVSVTDLGVWGITAPEARATLAAVPTATRTMTTTRTKKTMMTTMCR